MNSDRIKHIHRQTAFPDSVSVAKALHQVWNEVQQESDVKLATARATAFREGMVAGLQRGIQHNDMETIGLRHESPEVKALDRSTERMREEMNAILAASESAKVPEVKKGSCAECSYNDQGSCLAPTWTLRERKKEYGTCYKTISVREG